MQIIDTRLAQIDALTERMRITPSFLELVSLAHDRWVLEQEMRTVAEELCRLSQGWVYRAPSERPD